MLSRSMLLGGLSLLIAFSTANALELKFSPSKQLRSYQLDAAQGLRSVVVQNVAILNDGANEIAVSEVELALLEGPVVSETRTLGAAELDRIAAAGTQLREAGMLNALAFQFGGAALLPEGRVVASKRTLKPGEALLLTQKMLTFSGRRDVLRVVVQGSAGTSEAKIPISNELSRTPVRLPVEGMWHDGAAPSLHFPAYRT